MYMRIIFNERTLVTLALNDFKKTKSPPMEVKNKIDSIIEKLKRLSLKGWDVFKGEEVDIDKSEADIIIEAINWRQKEKQKEIYDAERRLYPSLLDRLKSVQHEKSKTKQSKTKQDVSLTKKKEVTLPKQTKENNRRLDQTLREPNSDDFLKVAEYCIRKKNQSATKKELEGLNLGCNLKNIVSKAKKFVEKVCDELEAGEREESDPIVRKMIEKGIISKI